MKPVEESILSAFLDGELDVDHRALVESAVQNNAGVADRVAELAQIRDLIAGLPRDRSPNDHSQAILARIAAERAGRIRRAQRLLVASCGLATAAAILVGTSALWHRAEPKSSVLAIHPSEASVDRLPRVPRPPLPPVALVSDRLVPTLAPSSMAVASELVSMEQQARQDALALDELLTGGEAREILVEVDSLDGPTLDKVESAIKRSNRREPKHAQLRLYQQVAIDPKNPGKAVAYILLMDDAEKKHFRSNLEEALPKSSRTEVPADLALVARLPQMGRMEIRGGLPRGTLLTPPPYLTNHEALRKDPRVDDAEVADHREEMRPANRDAAPGPIAADERPPCVYVVWVTSKERARSN